MGVRALAVSGLVGEGEAITLFEGLLGVVPGTSGVRHEDRHQNAGHQNAGQEAAEGTRAEGESDHHGGHDSHGSGQHHPLDGGRSRDVDTARSVGSSGALEETGDLAELAANLFDHLHRRFTHGVHGHGREQERHHAANEESTHHERVGDVDHVDVGLLHERGEEGECGHGGRTDGEALADGRRGVSDRVELVGDEPDPLVQLGHLGDAASVVGDGAVGVDGELNAGGREHAERCDGDAVEAGDRISGDHAGGDEDDRHHGRLHADAQAGDDVRGSAGLRLFGDRVDRAAAQRAVVRGDVADGDTYYETEHGGQTDPTPGDSHGRVLDVRRTTLGPQEVGQNEGHDNHQACRAQGTSVERVLGVAALLGLDDEGAEHRAQRARTGDDERQDHRTHPAIARSLRHDLEAHGKDHRADDGTDEGLEQVRAHAGHVTHVVTDVVGDHGGVPRIVFGETRLDLADQVRSDVGGLGIDAPAHAGEEGDRRGTEGEAGENRQHEWQAEVTLPHRRVDDEQGAQTDDGQTDDAEPHDRTAGEGDVESLRKTGLRGLCGTHVGVRRYLHPDVAGEPRGDGPDDEGERDERTLRHDLGGLDCFVTTSSEVDDREQDGDSDDEDREHLVLTTQERHRTFLDATGDLLHGVVTCVLLLDPAGLPEGEQERESASGGYSVDQLVHGFSGLVWTCWLGSQDLRVLGRFIHCQRP